MIGADALFWLALAGLVITTFAAIGARSLRKFSRHDLEEICRRHEDPLRFGEILREHDRVALGVEILVVLATSLLVVAGTYWVWETAGRPTPPQWWLLLLDALLLGLIAAAAIVWIPWAASRVLAETFIYHTWQTWKLTSRCVAPLVWGARAVDVVLHRATGKTPEVPNGDTFEEEIRTIVSEGHREGLLEEDAREMIEGVIELGDADVAEIMTPRTDMHMIHVETPWDELVQNIVQSGHTRIPVFNKTRDDIVGIVYSKDLLPELAKPPGAPRKTLAQLMRRPVFVPETKAVDDLLEMFQQMRTHIAIVLDEYGGVAGLVTIEDALEEIVGEIVDEYDEELIEELERLDDKTWMALGRAHVDEVNHALHLDLPEDEDYDTIAGFVFTELGRVPKSGEAFVWEGRVRFSVVEATRRRIERIRIEYLDDAQREIA
jgi:CBS domain containing-hemolysin-like protein